MPGMAIVVDEAMNVSKAKVSHVPYPIRCAGRRSREPIAASDDHDDLAVVDLDPLHRNSGFARRAQRARQVTFAKGKGTAGHAPAPALALRVSASFGCNGLENSIRTAVFRAQDCMRPLLPISL